MGFSTIIRATVVGALLALSFSTANAQGMFNKYPEPADNRAIGLAQGKQFVGLAGKCLTFDNFADSDEAKIRDCNPTAVNQRFKFENGQLKTSAKVLLIVGGDMTGMQYAWDNACLSAARDFNRIILKKCGAVANAGMQRWDLKGTEIRSGVNCFDVAQSNPANGNVVIYWGCQNQANQRWAMK